MPIDASTTNPITAGTAASFTANQKGSSFMRAKLPVIKMLKNPMAEMKLNFFRSFRS